MSNETDAVLKIWQSLRSKVDARIAEKTQNCIRAQRAAVVTAPNSTTGKIEVQIPLAG